MNLISTFATRAHKDDYYLFPAPRNQFTNTSCNSNNLKYANPGSQIPINNPLAKRNSTQFKQYFQNQNEKPFARRDTHFSQRNFQPIKKHAKNSSESQNP